MPSTTRGISSSLSSGPWVAAMACPSPFRPTIPGRPFPISRGREAWRGPMRRRHCRLGATSEAEPYLGRNQRIGRDFLGADAVPPHRGAGGGGGGGGEAGTQTHCHGCLTPSPKRRYLPWGKTTSRCTAGAGAAAMTGADQVTGVETNGEPNGGPHTGGPQNGDAATPRAKPPTNGPGHQQHPPRQPHPQPHPQASLGMTVPRSTTSSTSTATAFFMDVLRGDSTMSTGPGRPGVAERPPPFACGGPSYRK